MKRLAKLVEMAFALATLAMSAEILVRRWFFAEVPTQIPPEMVYILLLANALLLAAWIKGRGVFPSSRPHKLTARRTPRFR